MEIDQLHLLGNEIQQDKVDLNAINSIIEQAQPDGVQYASILAGGVCSADCYFCIGREIRGKQSAHVGNDWEGFLDAVTGRVGSYMSLSGTNSDPTLIKNIDQIIKASQQRGFQVSLHTNGFWRKDEPYDLSDKVTISIHSFNPETFSEVMRVRPTILPAVVENISRIAPTGKLKLSATYLPANADEISSGEYFKKAHDLGVSRVVIRKFTEWDQIPVLPSYAIQSGNYHGDLFIM